MFEERANVVKTFSNNYSECLLRLHKCISMDMWYIASRAIYLAHIWHKTYSVGPTKVLGTIGCIVTSNIMSIVTAKSNWKLVNVIKYGHRATASYIKYKQQNFV